MAIVGRILMVIIAYVLACIAASLVLTIGTLAPQWEQIASPDIPSVVLWSVVGVSAAVIAIVALLPSFLVIALAEGFAWRSIVLYGVLGGVLALALTYGIDFAGYVRGADSTFAHEREVLAASGIAGGLVYWVFAGRKAGLWKL
jgi:putative copper export protein